MKTNQNLFNPKHFCICFTSFSFSWYVCFSIWRHLDNAIFCSGREEYTQIVYRFHSIQWVEKKETWVLWQHRDKCYRCACACMFQALPNYKWTNVVAKLWFTSIHMSVYILPMYIQIGVIDEVRLFMRAIHTHTAGCSSMCDDKQHESE